MLNGLHHQQHLSSHHNGGGISTLTSHSTTTNSGNIIGGGDFRQKRIVQSSQISPPIHRGPTTGSSTTTTNEETWTIGTEVVALYNFTGKSAEDLTFLKGDILNIVALTKDPNWCRARRKSDGCEGMIPSNYVKSNNPAASSSLSSPKGLPWFHGLISREEAEARLKSKPNGAYLVRESTNFPGDYTLCLAFEGKVEHYRVIRKNNTLTCDEEEYFDNLNQLIEHYTSDADGLCHRLVSPVCVRESDTVQPHHHQQQQPPPKTPVIDMDVVDNASANLTRATKIFEAGWTINRRDLTLGDTIGKGEFGDVLIGQFRGEKVAVKGLRQSNQVVKAMLEEAELMTSLRHKHLVRLLGVVMGDVSDVYLVMEYMTNGSLIDYLRSRGRQQVTKRQQINFACDACEGMSYLESRNLVHRDLAARNILLAEDMSAKVSDFGLAKPVDVDKPDDASGKFPIKWTAPEALRHSKFTCKSDVWSFGILLWEIYSFGRVPYPRIPVQEVVRYIENGYRMEAPEGCSPEITEIMKETWCPDADRRPSFKQLLTRLRAYQSSVA